MPSLSQPRDGGVPRNVSVGGTNANHDQSHSIGRYYRSLGPQRDRTCTSCYTLVVNLSRHTKGSVTVKDTKDGVVIKACQGDYENSSDADVTLIVECSKPDGANDRVTGQTSEMIGVTVPIPLPSGAVTLPPGQVADLNTFRLAKGAVSPESAIDFPIATGDLNANNQRDPLDISVFGLINYVGSDMESRPSRGIFQLCSSSQLVQSPPPRAARPTEWRSEGGGWARGWRVS